MANLFDNCACVGRAKLGEGIPSGAVFFFSVFSMLRRLLKECYSGDTLRLGCILAIDRKGRRFWVISRRVGWMFVSNSITVGLFNSNTPHSQSSPVSKLR
jgi:hypothetical protein